MNLFDNILKEKNYSLVLFNKASDALIEISKIPFDLIVLDIQMPEMSGFELCNYIKNSKLNSNAPILFVTASNDEESILKGFEIGGADYIKKPYNKRELLARITTQIKLKKHRMKSVFI